MSSNLIPEQIQPKDEQNDFNNCSNFYKWNFNELDKIGEGGFGSVFKVSHKVDQMLYAIKIIKINDSTNTENILKEVKTLSKLNSDYVIRYYNSWFENESIFIQTELCSYNLDEFIKKKRSFFNRSKYETMNKLEYFISTHIFKDIIECVQYLHESNPVLIHRDLKPENILIKENAENDKFIKLGDFGLAKSSSKDTATHTKNVGTTQYKAPEIYTDTYSFKVDIYSLGKIGIDLFEYDINELNHNISDELKQQWNILHEIIDKMLKEKFRERPTCAEMIAAWNSYSIYISEQDRHDLIQSDRNDNFFFKLIESNSVKLFNYFSKNLEIHIQRHYKEEMERFLQMTGNWFITEQNMLMNHTRILKTTIDKYSPEKGHLTQENFEKLVKDSITDIFIEIEDENEVRRPKIGIELGTTNSRVAYFDTNRNNVVVIPNELGNNTIPSVVSFRDNDLTIVGDLAKDYINSYPKNTVSSAIRLIGRQFNDESVQSHINLCSYEVIENQNNNPMISVYVDGVEKTYKPEEISAQVLIKMKSIAENHLGCPVSKAVITVPAYFNDAQKEATKHAGRLAGLEVLRIINEPTAAAIAFKVDRNEKKEIRKVLIYQFGCGTFDVSILEINKGVIEVLAVGGDNNLGGDDFNTNLITYCLEQFKKQHNLKLKGLKVGCGMYRLRRQCEVDKMRLSSVESTILFIDRFYENHDLSVRLTRDKFEELNYHLFVKSMNLVKTTLADKNILPSDIDDIVLVGGSTRIPKIQELLSQLFGGRPLIHSENSEEAVAKGAAIQAALLNGRQSHGLKDL